MTLADGTWWVYYFLPWAQTAAVFATAIFAVIYTRETVQLRKEAQSQAKSAYNQLKIARQSFEALEADKERASHPYFLILPQVRPAMNVKTATLVGQSWTLSIMNKGAAVYWVRATCKHEAFPITQVGRADFLDKDEEFKINFHPKEVGRFPHEWFFEISYITLLHKPNVAHYRIVSFEVEYLDAPKQGPAAA